MTGADLPTLAMAAAAVWVAGSVLLGLLQMIPQFSGIIRSLWPLMLSEAAILAGGTVPFLLPETLIGACLLGAALRIGYETAAVAGLTTGRKLAWRGTFLAAGMAVFIWVVPLAGFVGLAAAIAVAAVISVMVVAGSSWTPAEALRFFLFPALPMACFVLAARHPELRAWLVCAFLLVELFDSTSLLAGRLFGRTPLVKRLSPRKTVEGLAGGIAFTIAGAGLLAAGFGLAVPTAAMLVVVVVPAAVAGDLVASAAKRRAGVKDYLPVLSMQGGLTDILDAWLVTGPVLAAILLLAHA